MEVQRGGKNNDPKTFSLPSVCSPFTLLLDTTHTLEPAEKAVCHGMTSLRRPLLNYGL
jgi:hypothetical protein